MRREEICQLACSSIYEYKSSGIWVFDIETIIEDGEETAGVKTEADNRIIPIHKTLIDLGLLEYRDDVMRHKHRRLFPDLNRTGMQNSDSFSGTVLRRLQKNSMASLPNLTCFTMNSLKS